MSATIDYGKQNIATYRTYATPLRVPAIPESPFTGRDNTLLACDIGVQVFGDNFLAAYTEGDNREVVATDTMKNFVLRETLAYGGATQEGLLFFLGETFLATYAHVQCLHMSGRELPFEAALVPQDGGFTTSGVLFSPTQGDAATAELELTRSADGVRVTAHRIGQVGLKLIKITGSSFADFARDDYTTLLEVSDRPLYIFLDVFWRYRDVNDLLGDHDHYVAAEQVRDLVGVVFDTFNSRSIQHLVFEMGQRLLARFAQLEEVSFKAQNRLWDTAFTHDTDDKVKVYCDPRPPYGDIGLTLRREDL